MQNFHVFFPNLNLDIPYESFQRMGDNHPTAEAVRPRIFYSVVQALLQASLNYQIEIQIFKISFEISEYQFSKTDILFQNKHLDKMSLYRMLFGGGGEAQDQRCPSLWNILDLDNYEVGRYRDIYVREGKIILLTRNGGGNREEYKQCFKSLRKHPNYLDDWDCDWDRTYAEISFSIPDGHEHLKDVPDEKDPGGRHESADEAIKAIRERKGSI
jgi:hypothetical protein